MDNTPLLDLESLRAILQSRDLKRDFKLSDIAPPSKLQNAIYGAKRIAKAIKEGEKIVLVGDYDVDGVTSTAICILFFRSLGLELEAHIPNRFSDGYGVSPTILERIEADVIFTVDNGISAFEAAKICKERGIDLIITDHHTPAKELPDCYTIINPKLPTCNYPHKDICGAQVAWLFLAAIKQELNASVDMGAYIEYLALAIIADVMPLNAINRTLVTQGLKKMKHSSAPYARVIDTFLNKSRFSSEDIGFQIAPRLNSAGRLEDASIALKFLIAEDEKSAYKHFELLNQLNELRKATEAEVTLEALAEANSSDTIVVVAGEGWNEGVVGIVASRLVDRFNRPAIVLSLHNGIAKGSARSIGNVNIHTLIRATSEHLLKFGGHAMAAGLSLDAHNIEAFKEAINAAAKKMYKEEDYHQQEPIIGTLQASAINFELLELLEEFEPYGEANPRPMFLAKNAEILSLKHFGADKSHSKLTLRLQPFERDSFEMIRFRESLDMPHDKKITCSFSLNRNEYNNRVSLQLLIGKIYK